MAGRSVLKIDCVDWMVYTMPMTAAEIGAVLKLAVHHKLYGSIPATLEGCQKIVEISPKFFESFVVERFPIVDGDNRRCDDPRFVVMPPKKLK